MNVPDGYLKNARGELIPETRVKPEDKLEDELVRNLAYRASDIAEQLKTFKALALAEAHSFKSLIAAEYGANKGGAKGNMTLNSYDGTVQMQVAISENLSFGPQLAAAKELIDGCVTRWAADANDNLKALVDHAFQVNKEGRVDTQRVLGLRKLDIQDDEWSSAMDAIADAIRVTGSKTYIRFYECDPDSEKRRPIVLDLANA